jgi:hypothetical protein
MYFIEEGSATLLYGTSWGVCWCDGNFASVTGDSKPFGVSEDLSRSAQRISVKMLPAK